MIVKFLIGMQASGKSTYCKQFLKDNQDWKCVNRDSIRHMLSNYSFDNKNEQLVTLVERKAIQAILDQGYNLIVDKMNINSKYLQDDVTFIQSQYSNVEFEYMEFPVTLGEAIERDKKRDFVIGESVLKQTWKKYEIQLKEMLERHKPKNNSNKNKPFAYLLDIDGTIAHTLNRRIFDEDKVGTDICDEIVKDVIIGLHDNSNYIIVVSGRQDSCREATEKWLKDNDVPYDFIFMRKAKDSRSDVIVKQEIYDNYIKDNYYVKGVFDDRPRVCEEVWLKNGIKLFCVNGDPLCKNNF
jgi:predicted kinase